MCGFIGIVSKNHINNKVLEESNENIICRGPDETKKYLKIQILYFQAKQIYFFH